MAIKKYNDNPIDQLVCLIRGGHKLMDKELKEIAEEGYIESDKETEITKTERKRFVKSNSRI